MQHSLRPAAALFLGLLFPFTALADAPIRQSRSLLGEAIRDTLIENPDLLAPVVARTTGLNQPTALHLYADDMAADLSALARAAPRLYDAALPGFGPSEAKQKIALFTRKDCAECAEAEAGLRTLSETHDLRVTLLDMDSHADLARDLGLDLAPSYVFGDMMLRGAMPLIVLERYLNRD